jgi:CBS domain-containing protein
MGGSTADTPTTPESLRASDAERDHAVGELRNEFVEGRLSHETFMYRMQTALDARHRGQLAGLFTDSDLARLFERRADDCFDGPVSAVMTRSPKMIAADARMEEAVALMKAHKISELPAIDADGRPVGLLDVTDLIGAQVEEPAESPPAVRVWDRASA